ncbi:MAG TPA: enoyl-CoA hydratase [Desulfobulbaceae bacterium]|nr:enoyl-CoA hydratase [Desulfobulbaceae bacterium]
MPDSSHPPLLCRQKENIAFLTLNRPDVLNALDRPLLLALKKELENIADNLDIRAVVISGAGDRAFSAGADIKYLNTSSPLQVRELARLAISVTRRIENLSKISVALINGFALGGGLELAESCMFRIAVHSARLGHPEVRIGAVAGWGGTTRLPRLIGKSRAAEMLLTGKQVTAEKALQMGLIHRVVDPQNLTEEGEALLKEILRNSSVAVNLTWEAMQRGLDLSMEESTRLGADCFGLVASSEDFREGTKAFLSKRQAHFRGR